MAKPRALRRRIRSIENTRQITKTMEMVAASKLKRAQDRVVAARPYTAAVTNVLRELLSPEIAERFALLRRPRPVGAGGPSRAAVLLITSNRGLAGAFNANLIREARRAIEALERAGYAVDLHAVGRKGILYFRFFARPLATARADIGDRPAVAHAEELARPLIAAYERGELAAVDLVFAKFVSPLSTPATALRMLPVAAEAAAAEHQARARRAENFILKPGADPIVRALLPLYVTNTVYRALVETAAAEHGARRTAMKNATDSAGDMLEVLRRTYNRARQAQITQELAEIVGGAEALRG